MAVLLVALVFVADIPGVLLHRDEFQSGAQWLVPGVAYALGAGVALWKWDWIARVGVNWRFAVVAVATVVAIWTASRQRVVKRAAGVPVLRAGELERLPTRAHALPGAVPAAWVLPSPQAFAESDRERQGGGQSEFDYDLPAGWTAQPSTSMRLINLRVGDDPRAECYLTVLPGAAGGLLDNANRWRDQMGAAPIDDAALAKLPTTKLLGRDATLIELDGTFTGMGGEPLENARMVGAISALPRVMLFVKMTGPREVLTKERPAFDQLLASVRMRGAGNTQETPSKSETQRKAEPERKADAGAGAAEGLRWTAPQSWTSTGDRPMRVVTFVPGGTDGVECYVTVLPGAAGGVLDNINRWRDQFGLAPQTQAEADALATVQVLGKDAPVVELSGTFTGMGSGPQEGFGLLGTIVPRADHVVFVKMTGPKAQVHGERERFLAFCRSLGGG